MPQKKKRPPIYVSDPKDPRLQAYNDSLILSEYTSGSDSYPNQAAKRLKELNGVYPVMTTYRGPGNAITFETPKQPIVFKRKNNKIDKLDINNNLQPYQPQQVQVPPYTPVDRTQEWYSNSQGIPIDTEDVQQMYNEDGTRKYQNGGSMRKKDKYSQVGPRDWMNQHGWYAERGGYKPQNGVLPQIMPGMYPGNVPMVMNQQYTEPAYIDIPAYAHGGYHARPGYFYNGHSMQKAVGSGTYDNGNYFQQGGYSHPLDTPFDTFEYGGDTDNGYTGSVSREQALRQIECMQMGGYPHPLDIPFDEFKKGGIHINPANKGKFNALKKRTGKSTEELTHSSNPLTRKRAVFAQNAKKWKHEYGGPVNPFNALRQYATGGPYDEDGGVSLPSANDAWGSSATNSEQQMQDAYQPVQDATQQTIQVDPYQNTRPPVSPERANMNETPVDASTFNNPYQVQPAQEQQSPRRNGALNWGAAIFGAGTGLLGAASILHDRYQNRAVQQQWIRDQNKSDNLPTMINPMSRGTYDQQGNIPYNNMSQSPNIRTMEQGGYVKGSTHELSEQEINDLIKRGFKLQLI